MTITLSRMVEGAVLGNAAATYYTSPAGVKTLIKNLTLTNPTGTDQIVTVYLVPAGGGANAASTLTYQKTVSAGKTVQLTEAINHVLEPGDNIQALASAGASITIMASGAQVS